MASLPRLVCSAFDYNKCPSKAPGKPLKISTDVKPIPRRIWRVPFNMGMQRSQPIIQRTSAYAHPTPPPIIEGINAPVHTSVPLGIYAPVILTSETRSTIPIAAALDLRSQQIGKRGVRPVVQGWTRHREEGMYWGCQWKLVKRGWVQGVT